VPFHVVLLGLSCSPCASHVKKHAHLTSLVVAGSQGNISLSPSFHPTGLQYDAGVVPGGFLVLYMDLPSWEPVSLPASALFTSVALFHLRETSHTSDLLPPLTLSSHTLWRFAGPGKFLGLELTVSFLVSS